MPFENQNHDANTDYLSDGVTESIINSLTQIPNLRVIARGSSFRYKGRDTDPVAAGHELGVRAVLTGRLLQRGDNLTVSAELVDVRDNKQLWGDQYERKISDLLVVQREIATEIYGSLRLKLSVPEQTRITKRYTDNPEAYELYLKGRFYWNKRTDEGVTIGHLYAISGRKDQALKVIQELSDLAKRQYVSSYNVGLIYFGLGEKDRGFEWLENAYQERSDLLVYLNSDPRLADVHADSRFVDLVKRVGLPH